MTVGKKIVVWDVISKSTDILSNRPVIMLPQLIVLIPNLLGNVLSGSLFNPLLIITTITSVVLSVIVSGAYPAIVKSMFGGGQLSMTDALRKAYHRFWSLVAAGFLVGILVILGFIALVVPGIILVTWYAYTVPAIMLEDKGATEGMAASKAFGRDKKWSTFLMGLIVFIVFLVLFGLQTGLSFASPLLGRLVYSILEIPVGAWASVIFAYTYITYGPSSVPVTTELPAYSAVPPVPMQPPVQAGVSVDTSSSNRFCASCGSPVQPNSKFCNNCGKAV